MKNIGFVFLFSIANYFAFGQDSLYDSTLWKLELMDVVVTAQYAPTDSHNAVHHVHTISKEQIKQRGVYSLDQLLRQELNIRISNDMILGSSINVQGLSGQNIQIMIDGVPIVGRMGDDIDLGQVNLNNIERVEIIDAPLSVNYGTNALGGVINLITKKSQLNRFETQFDAGWESNGFANVNASLGVRPFDKLLLRVQGGYNEFRGFNSVADTLDATERSFQWNPKQQYYAGASVRYDFGEDQQIRYAFNVFDEEVENLGDVRRPQFKPYAFDDYYHTSRADHSIHQEGTIIGGKFYLKTTLGYNYFNRDKRTYKTELESNEQNELEEEQDTTRFHSFIFRPVLATKNGDKKWDAQLGLDLRYENAFGDRINDPESDRLKYSEMQDHAIFGSFKYAPSDKLVFQAGVRAVYNDRFDAPIVPSINAKFAPNKNLSLRLSYAKGFRSPTLKELFLNFVDTNHSIKGNADLKAETSDNYQLVANWEKNIHQHKLKISVAGFYNDINQKIDLYQYIIQDGEIVPAPDPDLSSIQYAYFNQYRYKTTGGRLNIDYNVNNLGIKAGLSPIGRYNPLSETEDEIDVFTFAMESNAEISYRFPRQELQLSLYIKYNDKLITYYQDYDDNDNLITVQYSQDGFTLADFTASKYLWKKRIYLIAGVQNIFNVKNIPITGSSGGIHTGGSSMPIGLGRSCMFKLNWQFGWN